MSDLLSFVLYCTIQSLYTTNMWYIQNIYEIYNHWQSDQNRSGLRDLRAWVYNYYKYKLFIETRLAPTGI